LSLTSVAFCATFTGVSFKDKSQFKKNLCKTLNLHNFENNLIE
jgi:hypothetical protein